MSPQRRVALVSVGAAVALMGIKLATGLASGSLGLVSEALHSGTDLVAALLSFFAIGVAGRPADRSHPYGHGKAEHLAALAEAFVLMLVSIAVAGLAVARLAGWIEIDTTTAWWVFAAIGVVILIDSSRTVVSIRAARRYSSPALASNALHFGSDLVGTIAVLGGLLAVRAGWQAGDSLAALFVAFLVVVAARVSSVATSTSSWIVRLRTPSEQRGRPSRPSTRRSRCGASGSARQRGERSPTS